MSQNLKIDWATHEAAKFACRHWHYSGNLPAGKNVKFGIWEEGVFIGVIVFGRPCFPSIGKPFGLKQTQCVELTRIALNKHSHPVSKMISITLKMLKKFSPGLRLIISLADQNEDHIGGIYQASNWIYLGIGGASIQYKLNGKNIHQRNLVHKYGKNFNNHPLVEAYKPLRKHRYAYPLDEEIKDKILKMSLPYPKRASSKDNVAPEFHSGEGGVTPTDALQKRYDPPTF